MRFNMKIIKIILLLLSLLLLLSACKKEEDIPEEEPEDPIEELAPPYREPFSFTAETFPRIDGSPSAKPLAEAIASAMLGESRENITSLLTFGRTSEAFRNLANDLCDIIIVGEPSPGVIEEISAQDFRYDMAPIALDALVFIVSSGNPVDNLTSEQIRSIYTGEITGWQQVGGDDLDIIAFQRNEEAMSQVLMEKLVMDWQEMIDAPMQYFSIRHFDHWDRGSRSNDLYTAIKGFDSSVNAIGYTTYHYAVTMGMADGYKILSVDGVAPNADSLVLGNYPYVTPFYAAINKDLPEDDPARILFNWLQAEEGQEFIDIKAGYIWKEGPLPSISWDVQTDDTYLTPYVSPGANSTRLQEAAMPELVPADNYGPILPYATSVTMNDGRIFTSKYGFVAQRSGTVITDPIYDDVSRAMFVSSNGAEYLPAYHLKMDLPHDDSLFGYNTLQAACAIDGSWIIPLDYYSILFTEDVMLLLYYPYDTFNIDVYDYNGNLLYNMLNLEWIDRVSEDTWPEYFTHSVSEGVGFILLDNGTYAAVDILTGNIRETNFIRAFMFSDGLAAVIPQGSNLWGFVDKNLEFIIEHTYEWESIFRNNLAVVGTPDERWHIINKQADVLYSVSSDYRITHNYDGSGFMVYPLTSTVFPKMLTGDLKEIELPPQALPYNPESYTTFLGKGWYACYTENGMWLFNQQDTYLLPSNISVRGFIDGYILYQELNQNYEPTKQGIMRYDGQIIVEAESAINITALTTNGDIFGFAINTARENPHDYSFVSDVYNTIEYSYLDLSGQVTKSGLGILAYDEVSGLLSVQGTDYFAYMNRQGETIISIPSMAYTFD